MTTKANVIAAKRKDGKEKRKENIMRNGIEDGNVAGGKYPSHHWQRKRKMILILAKKNKKGKTRKKKKEKGENAEKAKTKSK